LNRVVQNGDAIAEEVVGNLPLGKQKGLECSAQMEAMHKWRHCTNRGTNGGTGEFIYHLG
jgi:hypothetical protein